MGKTAHNDVRRRSDRCSEITHPWKRHWPKWWHAPPRRRVHGTTTGGYNTTKRNQLLMAGYWQSRDGTLNKAVKNAHLPRVATSHASLPTRHGKCSQQHTLSCPLGENNCTRAAKTVPTRADTAHKCRKLNVACIATEGSINNQDGDQCTEAAHAASAG